MTCAVINNLQYAWTANDCSTDIIEINLNFSYVPIADIQR